MTIEGKFTREILKVKTGIATVGATIIGGAGAIILLPPPRYDLETFTDYEAATGDNLWNAKTKMFGRRLAAAPANTASAIKSGAAETPPPPWVSDEQHRLPGRKGSRKRNS